jgi:hypothetical protein
MEVAASSKPGPKRLKKVKIPFEGGLLRIESRFCPFFTLYDAL